MTDLGGLERPGRAYMQIGTAYYNLKRYGQAMQAFKEATTFSDYRDQAKQWVVFGGTFWSVPISSTDGAPQ